MEEPAQVLALTLLPVSYSCSFIYKILEN